MAEVAPKFTLPQAQRKYKFALTPLADAMFQLLIFFMLSSSLAPYALMTIRSGSPGDFANTSEPTAASTATQFGTVAIWTISEEGLTISGQKFAFDDVPALAAAITDDTATILIILRETASVQDLAHVVEALTAAGLANVQIAGPTA